ncbi:hypothetical protein CYY_002845 [Polysphondylium violaceum]|uniref:Oligopeptide transporter n=1 Tax=Polysphondylium violaceum TaxID=133409 RepID=A0A8J4PZH5_9MYCE|nr:hypothetical protein CYY_002845 [Polysphondylium violaceum]
MMNRLHEEEEEENGVILVDSDINHETYNSSDDDYNESLRNITDKKGNEHDGTDIHLKQITFRSIVAGIVVGGLMCFSNMYFGLQSGWVTMGSLQSTLLGFLFFKLLEKRLAIKFNQFENVLLQTIAVATATMPLAGGFVGIIPALKVLYQGDNPDTQTLPSYLSWWALTLWAFSLAFFGVFFAVPLRKQTILVEKLKFPSGLATAQMIKVLHKLRNDQVHPELLMQEEEHHQHHPSAIDQDNSSAEFETKELTNSSQIMMQEDEYTEQEKYWNTKWKVLFYSFTASALYTLFSYFFPILKLLPVFGTNAKMFFWGLTPSLSYVGQGMIMGTKTGISMFVGAVLGWAILGPMAKALGWAPGAVGDFTTGASGWILWISLFIMLSESIVSLLVLLVQYVLHRFGIGRASVYDDKSSADPAPLSERVPHMWWIIGLVVSAITCIVIVSPLYDVKFYETIVAVVMALLTSVLAVRALGETDLNPVSGIGKISQIIFAVIAPKNILSNLVAGAIAEAGAQQAGDMMQDLKTGHLLKASPKVQFYGQLIGSFFSIFFAVLSFELYSYAYDIPSVELRAPTHVVWLSMAKLVNGGQLATNVLGFCIVAGVLVSFIPIIEAIKPSTERFLPSGIALAIGMYVQPNYTIARCIGTVAQFYWKRKNLNSFREYMIIVASGFVLGEGITSIITAIMKAIGVPHL